MSVLEYATPTLKNQRRYPVIETIGWALFLGMSWTWCIGLFLPVLLVRDFGFWGWVVFAIPNVVGAAAMGWLLHAGVSEQICIKHRRAIQVFSIVTVGFQIYFLNFASVQLFRERTIEPVVLILLGSWLVLLKSNLGTLTASACLFGMSLICMCALFGRRMGIADDLQLMITQRSFGLSQLSVAAACMFGFALCPYLDATFHRARQRLTKRQSRVAFTMGFGCFFFVMILFSLAYSVTSEGVLVSWDKLEPFAGPILTLWYYQLTFTVTAHVADPIWRKKERLLIVTAALLLAVLASILMEATKRSWGDYWHVSGEVVYRLFLSFYGLIAPAYVWLCVIPKRGVVTPTQRMWFVTAIAVVLAMPFYWLAFFDNRMPFVLFGVAIVLAARLFVGSQENRVLV